MSELVFEIYGEEIPPRFQFEGEENLRKGFELLFEKENIKFSKLEVYSTSRRFVTFVDGLNNKKDGYTELIRGPATSAANNAIEGFLKSVNQKSTSCLKKKIINQKEYYLYENKIPTRNMEEILKKEIPNLLFKIKWSKSMSWFSKGFKWIRPIIHTFCIFDRKIILLDINNISSSKYFYGNYQYNRKTLSCETFKDYESKLKENFVILDRKNRIKKINNKLKKFRDENITVIYNDRTIDFVEYPNLCFGKFKKSYLKLPASFLIAVISGKQNYYAFQGIDSKGDKSLKNIFGYISNKKQNNCTTKDYEKVLNTRFLDAIYFLQEDKKEGLENLFFKLNHLKYFEGLGNLNQKSKRIYNICIEISKILFQEIHINNSGKFIHDKIIYSKADLVSNLVQEFPELQGHVGSHLLKLKGIDENICLALIDQYKPNSSKDECPKSPLSVCLSIADKIDHLVGIFLIGKKPSGSKDPFALRRSAFGLIRILIENKLSLNIVDLITFTEENYKKQKDESKKNDETKNNEYMCFSELKKKSLVDFLIQRLEFFLVDRFTKDIVKSVLDNSCAFDPFYIFQRLSILNSFIKKKSPQAFLTCYKRMNSILSIEELPGSVDQNLFKEPEEIFLYDKIIDIEEKTQNDFSCNKDKIKKFEKSLSHLLDLTNPINKFFDSVQINTTDNKIRVNRKGILLKCNKVIKKIYDFSNIIK